MLVFSVRYQSLAYFLPCKIICAKFQYFILTISIKLNYQFFDTHIDMYILKICAQISFSE